MDKRELKHPCCFTSFAALQKVPVHKLLPLMHVKVINDYLTLRVYIERNSIIASYLTHVRMIITDSLPCACEGSRSQPLTLRMKRKSTTASNVCVKVINHSFLP